MSDVHHQSRRRGTGCSNSSCASSCCFLPRLYRRLPLRTRSRLASAFKVILAVGGIWFFFDFLVPQFGRIDLHTSVTWYDLGRYGFMPTRSWHTFKYPTPDVEFLRRDARCSDEFYVFAPRGPIVRKPGGIIMDHEGEIVYRQTGFKGDTQDLRVQEFNGEKFLTFWVGEEEDGYKKGVWYMMDQKYNVRYQIKCKGGLSCDMHEFQITPEGTALIAIFDPSQADLTSIGSIKSGWLLDCIFQEIDIETEELLFEWRASDHFSVQDSYRTLDGCSSDSSRVFDGCGYYRSSGFDFYHINSLQKDSLGNYLVSGRNTHTITYVDGRSGDTIWNLGGRNNDFKDLSGGAATDFAFQHHSRWHSNTTLSLFDNGFHDWHGNMSRESRAMVLDLDLEARTAKLQAQYTHPAHMQSYSQGNAQMLEGGNVFVGWGRCAAFSEFAPDGELLCDVHFGASAFYSFGPVSSYRVFRERWTGYPQDPPSVVAGGRGLYVSWNGATEVKRWQLEGSDGGDNDGDEKKWEIIAQVPKTGFETEIAFSYGVDYSTLRVVGLDKHNKALGTPHEMDCPYDLAWLDSPLFIVIVMVVAMVFGTGLLATACVIYRRGPGLSARSVYSKRGRKGEEYGLLGRPGHDDYDEEDDEEEGRDFEAAEDLERLGSGSRGSGRRRAPR